MGLLPGLSHKKLVIFGLIYALLLVVGAALDFRLDKSDGMKVFGAYWASGQALLQGQNPFGIYPLTWSHYFKIAEVNLNPPTMLPLFQFVAGFSPVHAARVWTLTSGTVLLTALSWLFWDGRNEAIQRRQILWIFFLPAFASTLLIGQIYIFLFGLVVAAWVSLKHGNEKVAGIIIGIIVAAKPNLAVWPLFLLVAGHWRPVKYAVVSGLAIVILSLSLYGIAPYKQWLAAAAADTHAARFLIEVSIHGYMTRLGAPIVGSALGAILLIATTVLVWRQRFSKLDSTRLALVVAILASPIAWVDYVMFLIPAMIMRPWGRTLTMAAILLLVPVAVPNMMMDGPIWKTVIGGSIYFSAVLLIFVDIIRSIVGETASRVVVSSSEPVKALA